MSLIDWIALLLVGMPFIMVIIKVLLKLLKK